MRGLNGNRAPYRTIGAASPGVTNTRPPERVRSTRPCSRADPRRIFAGSLPALVPSRHLAGPPTGRCMPAIAFVERRLGRRPIRRTRHKALPRRIAVTLHSVPPLTGFVPRFQKLRVIVMVGRVLHSLGVRPRRSLRRRVYVGWRSRCRCRSETALPARRNRENRRAAPNSCECRKRPRGHRGKVGHSQLNRIPGGSFRRAHEAALACGGERASLPRQRGDQR